MANIPNDSKSYFKQEELPPPTPPEINIVPSPTGSQVVDGSLSSPNFKRLRSGWRISSEGKAEFQYLQVGNDKNYILWDGEELVGLGNLLGSRNINTYQPINGSTSPVAVFVDTDGTIITADASDTNLDDFDGFVIADLSNQTPATFLSSTTDTTSTTILHTLPAGTDRIIMVHIQCGVVPTPTLPTSVSWNGNTMTKILGDGSGYTRWGLWYFVAGTSTSPTTGNIVITGGTNQKAVFADNYQYVDQTNPFQDSDYVVSTSGTSVQNTLTLAQSYSLVVQYYADFLSGFNQTMDSSLTVRHTDSSGDHNGLVSDGYVPTIKTFNLTSTTNFGPGYDANNVGVGGAIAFKNSISSSVPIIVSGILGGFTGLTIGSNYYLSDTLGEISLTPGATSIRVGKAISSTEILIIQP